jgi:hypothetical protein
LQKKNAGPKKSSISPKTLGRIGAVIIIILMLYGAYALTQNGTISITSKESVILLLNQTAFINLYGKTPIAIRLQNTSGTGATFYVTRMPLLYGPVSSLLLAPYEEANVSSNGTQVADVNIRLLNSNSSGASIDVVPVPIGIGIKASAGIYLLPPLSFSTQVSTPFFATTTTTSTSTTSLSTSTIAANSTLALFQQALNDVNETNIGVLMKAYRAIYVKSAKCNASTYNSTYNMYHNSLPPAPVSFANVSPFTPFNITVGESKLAAKNNVLVTYSTVSHDSSTTGPAIVVIINTSNGNFLRNVSYVGLYTGFDFSILNSSYSFQKTISGSCSALISK